MKLNIVVPLNVTKVTQRLKRFGYQAFLVGGCVRDTLIGVTPKDWDIATDAIPEEIREVFDNSRLVGRRFPIAHVCFQGEIIEVVTYRDSRSEYGVFADDIYRRDFTVNALYWDDGEVIDPFTGIADIADKRIVCIGTAVDRFVEDPVRMLRAVRLMRLGFDLPDELRTVLIRHANLLRTVNKSRLYCEFVKVFGTGSCDQEGLLRLVSLDLLPRFFPQNMYEETEVVDLASVTTVICSIVWTYYCDLVGSCVCEFNLHPIPASQKAAKLLVEQLKRSLDVDRVVSLAIKEELYQRYRSECT